MQFLILQMSMSDKSEIITFTRLDGNRDDHAKSCQIIRRSLYEWIESEKPC